MPSAYPSKRLYALVVTHRAASRFPFVCTGYAGWKDAISNVHPPYMNALKTTCLKRRKYY